MVAVVRTLAEVHAIRVILVYVN